MPYKPKHHLAPDHGNGNGGAVSHKSASLVESHPELFEQLRGAQRVFDAIGDAFLVVDHAGHVLYCNNAARSLLGKDIDSITPGEWRTRFHYRLPDGSPSQNLDELPLMRALRGEAVTRQEMHLSGEGIRDVWVSVSARPVNNEAGQFEWGYLIVRDINLRKWSEEKMRLHNHAMDSASDGIVIADALQDEQPIIYVNEGFERLMGYSREEALDQPLDVLFHSAVEDEDPARARDELNKGMPATLELQRHTGKEGPSWTRLSVTPIHDQTDSVTHFIAILSDITDLIETERRLQETKEELESANAKITRANQRMKQDLEAAAKVQRNLLPTALPEIERLRFAWSLEASEELSGDILNVIHLDDDQVGMYILDVTGHGVASSMLSVTVSHLLTPIRSATSLVFERAGGPSQVYRVASPGKVATRLSRRFRWDLETGQFFTFLYGILNFRDNTFRYACAGHPPPILVAGGEARPLEGTGDLPIGLASPRAAFAEARINLEPGTRLYLYSDGIEEAMNTQGELFGLERMLHHLTEHAGSPLRESVNSLVERTRQWREGARQEDDTSLVAVEVRE
ncbi:MAG: SpoIIE family protein phosphatase [Candidatus Hydrogenedentota bacterium]